MKKYAYLCVMIPALLLAGCNSTTTRKSFDVTDKKQADYSQAYQDYIALGAQYVQKGRYDLAEPKLKRAIEIDSRPPEAWNILAVMYEQKRDISEGYQVYEKLITSHPDYMLGYTNFATFLCKFNRDAERQKLYERMRARGNDFKTVSYIAEGNCLLSRQNFNGAEVSYKQALALNPQASGALLPLADIALKKGDFAGSLRYLKVIHTYVGYSPESVNIGIQAARGANDSLAEQEFMRIMRANYSNSPQAKALGI